MIWKEREKMKNKEKIVLSISLLASNRKDTIQKCLDSLQPLRDAVSSELIIVDTGCDQDLHKMLEEYADKVICFQWCNDFSKARNAGLELASGEWFLYIDDDEWFVDCKDLVNFFQLGLYHNYEYANYVQRNYLDRGGNQYSDAWVTRMVRRTDATHFESKIHEYLDPLQGNCAAIDSYVDHYGYVYDTEEEKMQHYERNRSLLVDMIEEEPENFRWRIQLVQEYRGVKKYEKMLEFARESLKLQKDATGIYDDIFRGTFYVSCIESLMGLKRYEEALDYCVLAEADQRNTELCCMSLKLYEAETQFYLKHWEEAEECGNAYFKWYHKLKNQEKLIFIQKMAPIVAEVYDEVRVKKVYYLLICSGLKQKHTGYLKQYLEKLDWDKEYIYVHEEMMSTLVEAMEEMPYEEIFVQAAKLIFKHEEMRAYFCKMIDVFNIGQNEENTNIVHILAQIESQDEYIVYMKLLWADRNKKKEDIVQLLEMYFKNADNIFLRYRKIYLIAERNAIRVEPYILQIPFEQWQTQFRKLIENVQKKELDQLVLFLHKTKTVENIRYEYIDMSMAEIELALSANKHHLSELNIYMERYVKKTLEFYEKCFRKEILEQYPELLPDSVKTARWLWKAFQTRDSHTVNTLNCLKEAARQYITLTEAIQNYARQYALEQKEKEQKEKEEMHTLFQSLKEKVAELSQRGLFGEAFEVLDQLAKIKPQDLDIIRLRLEMRIGMLEQKG